MSHTQDRFFAAVSQRGLVRPSVRAIVYSSNRILVQRPADAPAGTNYAFIGGEYELGDTFEERLRREIEEETNARLVTWRYMFLVENRFTAGGHRVHALEHYLHATLDRDDVVSLEPHLRQQWLPLEMLHDADLRPFAVRDVIASGRRDQVRHLIAGDW